MAEVWSMSGHMSGRTAERVGTRAGADERPGGPDGARVGKVRAPGRPRSEKAEKAIIDAVVEMFADGATVPELSIEAIAARAGVGKTTIYRRWSNKEDLIADALATLKTPVPDTAGMSVPEGLTAYLRILQQESCHPRARCIMNIAMSDSARHSHLIERFDKVAIEPRRAALRALVRRGVEEGVLRPDVDVDVVMGALTGAMLYCTKWGRRNGGLPETLPEDLPERIVGHLMRGLSPS